MSSKYQKIPSEGELSETEKESELDFVLKVENARTDSSINRCQIEFFDKTQMIIDFLKKIECEVHVQSSGGKSSWPSYGTIIGDSDSQMNVEKYTNVFRIVRPEKALLTYEERDHGIGIYCTPVIQDVGDLTEYFDMEDQTESKIVQVIAVKESAYSTTKPLRKRWVNQRVACRTASVGESDYVFHMDISDPKETMQTIIQRYSELRLSGKADLNEKLKNFVEAIEKELDKMSAKDEEFKEGAKDLGKFLKESVTHIPVSEKCLRLKEWIQSLKAYSENFDKDNPDKRGHFKRILCDLEKKKKSMSESFKRITKTINKAGNYVLANLGQFKTSEVVSAEQFVTYLRSLHFSLKGYRNPTNILPELVITHEFSFIYNQRADPSKLRMLFLLPMKDVTQVRPGASASNYTLSLIERSKDQRDMDCFLFEMQMNFVTEWQAKFAN